MVSDVLLAGLAAGLATLALAVLYVGILAVKLNRQEQAQERPDPDLGRLSEPIDQTVESRDETTRRLDALRTTVARGLRGERE